MNIRLPISLALLSAALPASAQWRSTAYSLKAGWNSIYLNGDATWQSIEDQLADQADIVEVWRWNPDPASVQFVQRLALLGGWPGRAKTPLARRCSCAE